MKYHLSSSILAADFMELGKEIGATKRGGADRIHFDVMDGVFVPSISFGMTILESVRKGTDLFLDVHLMIVEPERYIEEFVKLGADSLTVHYEAAKDPIAVLKSIRSLGKKAGLAISPKTPPEAIKECLPYCDGVIVMTVEPGFGGQKIMPDCLAKIAVLREYEKETGSELDIAVDGGVKLNNVSNVLDAGANVIIAGSAVFGQDTETDTVKFMKILKEREAMQ